METTEIKPKKTVRLGSEESPKKGINFREDDDGDMAVSFIGGAEASNAEDETATGGSAPSAPPAIVETPPEDRGSGTVEVSSTGDPDRRRDDTAEAYQYEPEEKGESWDIYKQRTVIQKNCTRKSEDAVLIKAKADAALRAHAVAAAVMGATSEMQGGVMAGSEGRKTRGRTAIAQTGLLHIPDVEIDDSEKDSDSDDEAADHKANKDGSQDGQDGQDKDEAEAEADPAPTAAAAAYAEEPLHHTHAPLMRKVTDGLYPLEALQNGCPANVPPSQKEDFLDGIDFVAVFKMSKEEFAKMPAWKRNAAKKAAKLF